MVRYQKARAPQLSSAACQDGHQAVVSGNDFNPARSAH